MNTKQLIYQYLDNSYPIEDNTVQVNIRHADLFTRRNTDLYTQEELEDITVIDIEIIDIFGTKIHPHFFEWTEQRIGKNIQLQFLNMKVNYSNRNWSLSAQEKKDFIDNLMD